jgi:OPC-8:0 CoA ligase-1
MGSLPEQTVFRSTLPDIAIPDHLPLHDYVFERLAERRDRACIIDGATGKTLTVGDVYCLSRRVAAGLYSLGVRHGSTVLLFLPNSVEFALAFLASSRLGAITTTASPLHTPPEIAKQVADACPVLAFTTRDLLPKLPLTTHANLQIILLEPAHNHLPTTTDPRIIATIDEISATTPNPSRRRDRVTQDDQATLLYSSGTTGPSKGVVATHRNLISMVQIVMNRFRLDDSADATETFLCTVPMFHVYGLVAFATGLLGCGATVVVLSKFELPEMLRCITAYGVTYLPLVPPILVAMVAHPKPLPLGNLRKVLSGGAPLSKELIEGFRDKYPRVEILQGYGLTESTAIGASTDSAEESRRYGTAGLLSPNTEAKIVDPGSGEALPVNRTGELWIRGPYVMKGTVQKKGSCTMCASFQLFHV